MNKYWVGGSGNWNDPTNHWATASGGTPGAGNTPTASDDVFFDSLSYTTDYTVTINASAVCKSMTWANPSPSGKPTMAGSSALAISGSLTMVASMGNTYTGTITFNAASGTSVITSAGVAFAAAPFNFNTGGTVQLADNLTTAGNSFTLTAGAFDPNGKLVTLSAAQCNVYGAFTFYDLTRTGTAAFTNQTRLNANITVSHNLTITGYSATQRMLIFGDWFQSYTITCNGAVSVDKADFRRITGAGSASWDMSAAAGFTGDCGMNSGMVFTTPASIYWKHTATASLNWSSTNWWTATNGGGSAARMPLPQDTAIFNSDSFSVGSGKTVVVDITRVGGFNFTGATNSPTFNLGGNDICGSITIISAMTYTAGSNVIYNTCTITTNGHTNMPAWRVRGTGTVTLADTFLGASGAGIYQDQGTITANGDVTIDQLYCGGTYASALNMGNGLWTIIGTSGFSYNNSADNGVLNGGNSTLKFTAASSGGTIELACSPNIETAFYNIWLNTTGTSYFHIWGKITCVNQFKTDASRTIRFETNSFNVAGQNGIKCADFVGTGTSGTHTTLNGIGTVTWFLTKTGGGYISVDYMSLEYSAASPGSTWYAGAHSTNTSHNTGWLFTVPPIMQIINDTVTVTDTFVKNITKNLAETISVSDSNNKVVTKNLFETISVLDSISFRRDLNLHETVNVADTISKVFTKAFFESITVTDDIEELVKVGGVITKNIYDTVTVSDSLVTQLRGTPNYCYMVYENKILHIYNGNVEIARFKQDGSLDLKGSIHENAF